MSGDWRDELKKIALRMGSAALKEASKAVKEVAEGPPKKRRKVLTVVPDSVTEIPIKKKVP